MGVALLHLAAIGAPRKDDFQDLAAWRWLGARVAPAAARRRAIASPIPVAAPVTIAVWEASGEEAHRREEAEGNGGLIWINPPRMTTLLF